MPQMISIVGKSGSGKTTLIEKLLPELKNRGYRIGTVKHTHHTVDADKKGKDSARHREAGADTVILAAQKQIYMVKDMPCDSLESLEMYFQDMDLVITEGYKNENRPKIEVFRIAAHKTPLYAEHRDKHFVALVTDADIAEDIPCFGMEDIIKITDFIEKNFCSKDNVQSG